MCRDKEFELSGLEQELEFETEAAGGGPRFRYEIPGDDAEADDAGLELEAGGDALDDSRDTEFVERLLELSHREFESDAELDQAVGEVVSDMEREYFFGGLKKLARRGLSLGAQALLRKAKGLAGGLPLAQGLKALTQLSRGNLTGSLKSLAKTGLATALRAHPAGAAALATLKGLGFASETAPSDREAWQRFVGVSREAFEHLARNLDAETATPSGAGRQAAQALQAGLQRRSRDGRGNDGHRVLRLRPGQRVTIVVE